MNKNNRSEIDRNLTHNLTPNYITRFRLWADRDPRPPSIYYSCINKKLWIISTYQCIRYIMYYITTVLQFHQFIWFQVKLTSIFLLTSRMFLVSILAVTCVIGIVHSAPTSTYQRRQLQDDRPGLLFLNQIHGLEVRLKLVKYFYSQQAR